MQATNEVFVLGEVKRADVEVACDDFRARSLEHIPCDFARLLYLASTRDYNTGRYYHEGMARHFGADVAALALASCHKEVFTRLLSCPVGELVNELEAYAAYARVSQPDLVRAWTKLQSLRVVIPLECGPLTAQFFCSNVTAALAVLHFRHSV
jgi:hypothetical protein